MLVQLTDSKTNLLIIFQELLPILRYGVCFYTICDCLRHNGICELDRIVFELYDTALVSMHKSIDVETVVGRRKIYLNLFIGEILQYEVDRRDKVCICAYEHDNVSRILEAVSHHPYGQVDVSLFLFWTADGSFAEGTHYCLVDVLSAYDLELVRVEQSIRIQECALTAALVRVERGGCEINHFRKFLVRSEELLEEFDDINPIVAVPLGINVFHPFQAIVEVESINVESNPLFIHIHIYNKSRYRSG